jgi:hypothetical protein
LAEESAPGAPNLLRAGSTVDFDDDRMALPGLQARGPNSVGWCAARYGA